MWYDFFYLICNLKVKCGVRGDTGPACNAVGMIDRKLLGLQHLYRRPIYSRTEVTTYFLSLIWLVQLLFIVFTNEFWFVCLKQQCSINSPDYGPLPADAPSWCQSPFDPEGLLSSLMAIVTCLVGLHYGHIINHFKDHRNRVLHWTISSTSLVVLGLALDLFGRLLLHNFLVYSSNHWSCCILFVTKLSASLVFRHAYK